MNKKTYLEAPSAELIVVRFEGNFCTTGFPTNQSSFDEQAEIDDQSGANWWN